MADLLWGKEIKVSKYTISSISQLSNLKDLKEPFHTNITVGITTPAGYTSVSFDPHGMDIMNMTVNEIGDTAYKIFTERLAASNG
ncbi:hypothetical protein [Yersinia massiliensis]|uniref:hypothetical protein n=1 Tax=Yersinia massiliensis TaxID=419257 RepID=UPI00209C6BAF|nr:hypothetical protein [Yersinia massiliensis]